MKLLILEDTSHALDNLLRAVDSVFPKYFPGFTRKDIDVARWYKQAEGLIDKKRYDAVLLDRGMPYYDPEDGQYNPYHERFKNAKFCNSALGYSLIPRIWGSNPTTFIIGTSAADPDELRLFPEPDAKIWKGQLEPLIKNLEYVMREMFTLS